MSLILRNIGAKLHAPSYRISKFCTAIATEQKPPEVSPIITRKKYVDENTFFHKPREVWLENLDTIKEQKLGLVTLHPEVYASSARIDIIHKNVTWQRMYRYVCYANTKTTPEISKSGKKPWPQKGTGRARHSSIRTPLWKGGSVAHGPRSPTPHFYMLPFHTRVAGLAATLSCKLAQDDLHVVKDLEIPTSESSYIDQLVEERNWGPSVLFVDSDDIMPVNITKATDEIRHVNLMPVYGLNVYSMLKHDTLVLTESAANLIEEKLLFHLNRTDDVKLKRKFRVDQQ